MRKFVGNLYIPDSGTNLLGRDSIIQLGLELKTQDDQIVVSMALLTEEDENQIDPIAWVREGNRGGLNITTLKIKLKRDNDIICQKQYAISLEGCKSLQPFIESLIKDKLLKPCMSPFNTPILSVKKKKKRQQTNKQNPRWVISFGTGFKTVKPNSSSASPSSS